MLTWIAVTILLGFHMQASSTSVRRLKCRFKGMDKRAVRETARQLLRLESVSSRILERASRKIISHFSAVDLAPQGRRRDPRHRREVRRQSGHRHRLDVGADRHQPRPLGLRPAALAVLRLRRRQRPVRLRLEPVAARRSPARPTRACRSISTPRSRTSSSSPAPKTWCRCSAGRRRHMGRGSTDAADSHGRSMASTTESAATGRASKGCSPASSAGRNTAIRATSTGARSPRTTSSPLRQGRRTRRIADPADPSRIFSWLICETPRRQGQRRRLPLQGGRRRSASISARRTSATAGRRTTSAARPTATSSASATATARLLLDDAGAPWPRLLTPIARRSHNADWMFEVVFDYGEHDADRARRRTTPGSHGPAPRRPVLLLPRRLRGAHLPPVPARPDVPPLPGRGGRGTRLPGALDRLHLLRRSTTPPTSATPSTPSCARSPRPAIAATTAATTSAACRRSSSSTPSPSCRTRCEEVDPASLENLPIGLDGSAYQWTDLHGEGIPGILTEQAGAWFYKRNLSPIPTSCPTAASR